MLQEMDEKERNEKIQEIIKKKNEETVDIVFAIPSGQFSSEKSLKGLLSMLINMVQDYNATYYLMLFDSEIRSFEEIYSVEDLSLKITDSKDCNYDKLFEHIGQKFETTPENCIILSDMEGEISKAYTIPTIWITSNKEFFPLFGQVNYI